MFRSDLDYGGTLDSADLALVRTCAHRCTRHRPPLAAGSAVGQTADFPVVHVVDRRRHVEAVLHVVQPTGRGQPGRMRCAVDRHGVADPIATAPW